MWHSASSCSARRGGNGFAMRAKPFIQVPLLETYGLSVRSTFGSGLDASCGRTGRSKVVTRAQSGVVGIAGVIVTIPRHKHGLPIMRDCLGVGGLAACQLLSRNTQGRSKKFGQPASLSQANLDSLPAPSGVANEIVIVALLTWKYSQFG